VGRGDEGKGKSEKWRGANRRVGERGTEGERVSEVSGRFSDRCLYSADVDSLFQVSFRSRCAGRRVIARQGKGRRRRVSSFLVIANIIF